MADLRAEPSMGARLLEFIVLTASRTGEAAGATWEEIDPATKTWTVPADRMKAGREHRVPLSAHALSILNGLPRQGSRVFVFHAKALHKVLKRVRAGVTTHGFRSAFRDWCRESTNYPDAIAEAALAHVVGDKTVAAYQRGDRLEQRRRLMDRWGQFCCPSEGEVVQLRA